LTVFLALSCLFPLPGRGAGQAFTLQEVLSSPMPSALVSSPVAGAVAWVQNREGVRNIYVAVGPEYVGRRLTTYTEDDGYGLGALKFTTDGRFLVYSRGGDPNRRGQFPNPRSFIEEEPISSFIIPVEGGNPRKLPNRGALTLAPDGRTGVYASEGAVYRIDLHPEDEEEEEPEKLFEVRNGAGSLTYSPDGSSLAFVSRREKHSFVGVWKEGADRIRWMSPGIWSDGAPVWSTDGTQVAFLRTLDMPGLWPFVPVRETVPFSIRVAEVATGESREVFRADEGPGSAYHPWGGDSQLYWADGDQIVFPWEKNGWLNLWSVPATGGNPVPLTPGEFEVQFGTISTDRREIVYDSNQGDMDRKHLWRVPVDGSRPPRPITRGGGIEWSPVMTADGTIVFLASDGVTPAHVEVLKGEDGRRPLLPEWMPADFPREHLVQPTQVIFSAADGLMVHGQLFLPDDIDPGEKRPAVVFFHGGSRRQMLLGFHHSGYYHNAYALNQYLAGQGYVVLSVNYRSGIGYGLAFREARNYGAAGASEFNDVMGAGAYLRSREDVDPDRIGLWGGSYGGYLTALGLARASEMFAAGVDIHGVHDWNVVIHGFRPDYDRGQWEEFSELAFQSSPLADVESWRSPVLLIHGDDDRNVPFSESVDLAYHLSRHGVYFEELVFPDEVHGFLLHANWLEAYRAADDFFRRMLMEGGAADLTRGDRPDPRSPSARSRPSIGPGGPGRIR
jgi:dipeptidyl aminopeptidase/acylaminoacyl peptidase